MDRRAVLFVEDNRYLIQDLVRTITSERPGWKLEFADDIPSAWDCLCKNEYDLIVMDVMLPSWPGVPQRSEGIFLVKWLLNPPRDGGESQPPRGAAKEPNRKAKIIFLTSRDPMTTGREVKQETKKDIPVIGRLRMDAYEQFEKLAEVMRGLR